jgi:hypothetical protein
VPTASDAEQLDECRHAVPPDDKSMMTACQKPAQLQNRLQY